MKDSEQWLNKAFALARRRRDIIPSELPFGMETAVLTEWRSSRAKIDVGMLPVFRWAAILACVFALVSGAWKRDLLMQFSNRFDPETAVLKSAFAQLDS